MKFYTREDVILKTTRRSGEVKIGETIACLEAMEDLDDLQKHVSAGVKFALIGIPECIGIRANYGRGGAERGWNCFLNSFLNMQSNRFLSGGNVLCLGNVYTDELQAISDRMATTNPNYIVEHRDLCSQLDDVVYPIIAKVVKAGLIPIIIGGGHNNTFPILKGFCQNMKFDNGLACLNCDPHADFRPLEGRHSGNAFSYAYEEGFLKRYYMLGLHENYNAEAMVEKMEALPEISYSFQNLTGSFESVLEETTAFFNNNNYPVGLELDLDSIANMPSSASSPSGITIEQARRYIMHMTRKLNPVYLHLPEGAPTSQLHEQFHVGKTLAFFVSDFIRAYSS